MQLVQRRDFCIPWKGWLRYTFAIGIQPTKILVCFALVLKKARKYFDKTYEPFSLFYGTSGLAASRDFFSVAITLHTMSQILRGISFQE